MDCKCKKSLCLLINFWELIIIFYWSKFVGSIMVCCNWKVTTFPNTCYLRIQNNLKIFCFAAKSIHCTWKNTYYFMKEKQKYLLIVYWVFYQFYFFEFIDINRLAACNDCSIFCIQIELKFISQLIIDYSFHNIFETRFDNVSYLSNEWILECFLKVIYFRRSVHTNNPNICKDSKLSCLQHVLA